MKVIIGDKIFKSRTEAAAAYGISVSALYRRLKLGWTEEDFEKGYRRHTNNWKRYSKRYNMSEKLCKTIKSVMDFDNKDELLILKEVVEKRLEEIEGN